MLARSLVQIAIKQRGNKRSVSLSDDEQGRDETIDTYRQAHHRRRRSDTQEPELALSPYARAVPVCGLAFRAGCGQLGGK